MGARSVRRGRSHTRSGYGSNAIVSILIAMGIRCWGVWTASSIVARQRSLVTGQRAMPGLASILAEVARRRLAHHGRQFLKNRRVVAIILILKLGDGNIASKLASSFVREKM